MSDGFTQMLDEAEVFFTGLAANNTKDWFEPRKEHYIAAIRKPAEMMAEFLAEDLSRLTRAAHSGKVFRIYRDVRFSKDKTPYNAHLHIAWTQSAPKDGALAPGFFFGAEPGSMFLAMGVMGLEKEALMRYRAMVDAWGDQLTDLIEEGGLMLSDYGPPPLKKPPAPYDKDHPHADLLCRKVLIVQCGIGPEWRAEGMGLVKAVRKGFERFLPLHAFLRERLG